MPKLLGWDKKRTNARVDELLDTMGLDPATFADRYPHQLSGGQRQRVGVARALAADPDVLLMDEPFGAVDPIVRGRLQDQFLDIQATLAKTVVLVTHDIEEAVRLGDRVAVFEQGGRLAQYDTPARVLGAPADDFVAEFVGADRGLRRLAVTADRPGRPRAAAGRARHRHAWPRPASGWTPRTPAGPSCSTRPAACAAGSAPTTSQGDGTVADRAERMDAWVDHDASLKDALATMLQWDAGWVAVLEGDDVPRRTDAEHPARGAAPLGRTPKRKASPWSHVDVAEAGPLR